MRIITQLAPGIASETSREFTVCSNAGDFPAMASLATDELMTRPPGRIAIHAGHLFAGRPGTPAPSETPTAAALDAYVIALQFAQPVPQTEPSAILEIRDVPAPADGRVWATVVTASQDEPKPETDTGFLRWAGDRYLIEGTFRGEPAESVASAATPATPGAG